MNERSLSWAQTAALNPNTPQCSGCGVDLSPFSGGARLRHCKQCRHRVAPAAAFPSRETPPATQQRAHLRAAA
jgi:predicted amidophosphoribosyltransferase